MPQNWYGLLVPACGTVDALLQPVKVMYFLEVINADNLANLLRKCETQLLGHFFQMTATLLRQIEILT